jgi:hypothetical protein
VRDFRHDRRVRLQRQARADGFGVPRSGRRTAARDQGRRDPAAAGRRGTAHLSCATRTSCCGPGDHRLAGRLPRARRRRSTRWSPRSRPATREGSTAPPGSQASINRWRKDLGEARGALRGGAGRAPARSATRSEAAA